MMAEPIKREGLGSAFAGAGAERAVGLGGLLRGAPEPAAAPEASPLPAPAPPPEPVLPAEPVAKPVTPKAAAKPAPAPRAAVTARHNAPELPVVLTPSYLPQEDLDALKQAARTSELRYDEILTEAFEHVDDAEIAAAFQPDGALPETRMPGRRQRQRGRPGIQVQFRLTPDQQLWLDAKAAALGAPSRSALIASALSLHLPKRSKS